MKVCELCQHINLCRYPLCELESSHAFMKVLQQEKRLNLLPQWLNSVVGTIHPQKTDVSSHNRTILEKILEHLSIDNCRICP